MKMIEKKFDNYDFFYRVGWSVNDFQCNYYPYEEEFRSAHDLSSARNKAFEYFINRKEYIIEQKTFFGDKQISSPANFELGKNLAWTVSIEFNFTVDGIEHSHMIVEGGIEYIDEEIFNMRVFESYMFGAIGLPVPMW